MTITACPHCGTKIKDDSEDECQFCRRPLTRSKSKGNRNSNGRDDKRRALKENPFEAPESDLEELDDLVPVEMWVDGKCLVVHSGVVLPLFCVKTNKPIAPKLMTTKSLTWCSPYLFLLYLVNPLIFIIAYYASRKECRVSFGFSPEYSRVMTKRLLLKVGILIVSIFHLVAAITSGSAEWIVVASGLLVIALIALFLGDTVLRVKKHKNDQFWLSGCSKEFLARIEDA